MENRADFDKLIVSYLMKELNAEEQDFLIKSINDDVDLQARFSQFQQLGSLLNIKQGIDSIDLAVERERLESLLLERKNGLTDDNSSSEEVNPEIGKIRRISFVKWVAAIAALLVIVAGTTWFLARDKQGSEKDIAVEKTLEREKPEQFFRIEENKSGKTRSLQLQDGTEILLYDQTELKFKEPFDENKRDITLIGKASFKVAKDSTRPFTVYSGDIATTALGTEFVVTNYEKDQVITVRLLEGRVIIKSADAAKEKLKTDFYLAPGQELLYNRKSVQAEVRKFNTDNATATRKTKRNKLTDNPSIPDVSGGSWFMFNNQSLPDIFDQLKSMYGVDIVYNRKDLERLYFIGKFNKIDSVEYILRNIAKVNRLTLSKENNKFIIRK